MGRFKGTFVSPSNYEVKMQAAFDPRILVEKKADLINKETFPYDGDTIYLYKGILVSVQEENAVYMLVDMDKILSTDYSGWLRVDAGNAEQVEVVDNLESDASDKALSAKQGKVLMNEISTITGKISAVYTPKGSKTFEELPTDAKAGDVYNVTNAFTLDGKKYPVGTNVVWTGTEWDALGGSVDLSNYATKDEVSEGVQDAKDYTNEEISSLSNSVEGVRATANEANTTAGSALSLAQQNERNIASMNLILNGNNNPDDDITDTVGLVTRLENVENIIGEKDEDYDKGTLLTRLDALESLVTGGEGGGGEGEDQTLLQKVNANTLAISNLQSVVGGENSGLVKAVNTLNADKNTSGSVDYKIDQAMSQAFKWVDVE